MVVVFTWKDSLEDEDNKTYLSLKQYVNTTPDSLKNILCQCCNRYIGVNNKAKGKEKEADIEDVMTLIDQTIYENEGGYYTGEMYAAAEKALTEKIQKIEDEKLKDEQEIQRRKDELDLKENKIDQQIKALEKLAAKVSLRNESALQASVKQGHELQKIHDEMKDKLEMERKRLNSYLEDFKKRDAEWAEERKREKHRYLVNEKQMQKRQYDMQAEIDKQRTEIQTREREAQQRDKKAAEDRKKEMEKLQKDIEDSKLKDEKEKQKMEILIARLEKELKEKKCSIL